MTFCKSEESFFFLKCSLLKCSQHNRTYGTPFKGCSVKASEDCLWAEVQNIHLHTVIWVCSTIAILYFEMCKPVYRTFKRSQLLSIWIISSGNISNVWNLSMHRNTAFQEDIGIISSVLWSCLSFLFLKKKNHFMFKLLIK